MEITDNILDDIFSGKVKLLPCQRERMRYMHSVSSIPYIDLARMFGISKTRAYYICNTDKERSFNIEKAKNWKPYYKKEKATVVKRNTREKHRVVNSLFNN